MLKIPVSCVAHKERTKTAFGRRLTSPQTSVPVFMIFASAWIHFYPSLERVEAAQCVFGKTEKYHTLYESRPSAPWHSSYVGIKYSWRRKKFIKGYRALMVSVAKAGGGKNKIKFLHLMIEHAEVKAEAREARKSSIYKKKAVGRFASLDAARLRRQCTYSKVEKSSRTVRLMMRVLVSLLLEQGAHRK